MNKHQPPEDPTTFWINADHANGTAYLTVEQCTFAGAPTNPDGHIAIVGDRVYLRGVTLFPGDMTARAAIRWGVLRIMGKIRFVGYRLLHPRFEPWTVKSALAHAVAASQSESACIYSTECVSCGREADIDNPTPEDECCDSCLNSRQDWQE